ncbi:hypothetical protein, partial [Bacillus pumilus]|uniref:hypothetical protein n=1 Tax=Bacillus pumilus TaxID=1408 RepID=UPI001C92C32A
ACSFCRIVGVTNASNSCELIVFVSADASDENGVHMEMTRARVIRLKRVFLNIFVYIPPSILNTKLSLSN